MVSAVDSCEQAYEVTISISVSKCSLRYQTTSSKQEVHCGSVIITAHDTCAVTDY